jgi:acyl-CoA thioesterase-1
MMPSDPVRESNLVNRPRPSDPLVAATGPAAAAILVLLLVSVAACSGPAGDGSAPAGTPPEALQPTSPEAPLQTPLSKAASPEDPLVIFLGDSITAGHGLAGDDSFPSLVQDAMEERGLPVRIINAGVSGDTSSGGVSRLDWLLRQGPSLVVVELGANDGLRGLPVELVEENLRRIIIRSRTSGAQVILAGMRVPPNYGSEYSEAFHGIYARLAGEFDVILIPFILDGVAGIPSLNLPDGIHPTAEGHRILARKITPYVEEALREAAGPAH